MDESIAPLRMLLISFAASVSVIFGGTIYFSSSKQLDGFLIDLRNAPIVFAVGALVAVLHGFFTGLFLMLRKSDSLGASITASLVSMEIIALLICLLLVLMDYSVRGTGPDESRDFRGYLLMVAGLARIFLWLSVFLALPAVIVGFVNRFLLANFR